MNYTLLFLKIFRVLQSGKQETINFILNDFGFLNQNLIRLFAAVFDPPQFL